MLPPPKSTTIYVGKIAPSVPDNLVRKLLDACGAVKSWNRQKDPETKMGKAFGFCEMEEPEGVLMALRILNGREIHGQALLVKCNQVRGDEAEKLVTGCSAYGRASGRGEGVFHGLRHSAHRWLL